MDNEPKSSSQEQDSTERPLTQDELKRESESFFDTVKAVIAEGIELGVIHPTISSQYDPDGEPARPLTLDELRHLFLYEYEFGGGDSDAINFDHNSKHFNIVGTGDYMIIESHDASTQEYDTLTVKTQVIIPHMIMATDVPPEKKFRPAGFNFEHRNKDHQATISAVDNRAAIANGQRIINELKKSF